MNEQGIMALPQGMQAPTAQPPAVDPAAEAAFEQARQQISPKEFSDEIMGAAEQVDPASVKELRQALSAINLPPEVIDAMQQMVEVILQNPQDYGAIRSEMISDGVPEDLLPETFDAQFFGPLRVALDQIESSVMQQPVQAFAQGGIANLRPIAQAMQGMGRGQDTLLAHITPQEARMLQRQGGIGTINPITGLPEYGFFKSIGKAFKSVGKAISGAVKGIVGAVKKFASSTVGRMIATVALGFFLGPAAASLLGVTSAAGVAAISGFVGSFGSTMLAGGSFKDALKAGAIGGITAGAGAGIAGGADAFAAGSYTGPTTVGGQFDRFTEGAKSLLSSPEVAPPPTSSVPTVGEMATSGVSTPSSPMPAQSVSDVGYYPTVQADALNVPSVPGQVQPLDAVASTGAPPPVTGASPSFFESPWEATKDFYTQNISPSGIQAAGEQNALAAYNDVLTKTGDEILARKAYDAAMPGMFTKYAPMVAAGTALAYGTGMFDQKPPEDLNLAPKETGYDLLRQQPGIYGTTPGGAQTVYSDYSPMGVSGGPFGFQRPNIQMRAPQYPTFAANGGEIRQFAGGGFATAIRNTVGAAQEGQPQARNRSFSGFRGIAGLVKRAIERMRAQGALQKAVPNVPAQPSRPFFVPGGAQTVPIQQNLAEMVRSAAAPGMFAQGGIAAIAPRRYNYGGYANGGPSKFPRRNGQISGPGTEKSDSIPAMLSDGEFVMTAQAVRGAGNGSRREGAKRMYQMMHKLERMA